MPSLLLSRTFQPEAERLAIVSEQAQWYCQWLDRDTTPIRLHGTEYGLCAEIDLALRVAAKHDLALIEPSLDLLALLPIKYTQREVRFASLADALELPHRTFVKPADCASKVFEAQVCEAGKYIRCGTKVSRQTPVLLSDPVIWDVEYRVIVLDRRIVTFSPYIRAGRFAKDRNDQWPYAESEAKEMLALCEALCADDSVSLPPVFTLDLGVIAQRGWAVVEFNPVWCSGLLGCDHSKMLPVYRRACQRRDELSPSDSKWVIDRRFAVG